MNKAPADGRLLVFTDAAMVAGAERALATVVQHLPPWVSVTVAGPDELVVATVAGARPGARSVLTPPLAAKADLVHALALRRILLDQRPSAVHLNKTEVAGLRYVELVARSLRRTRVVSVVHHVEPPATRVGLVIARRLASTADAIVAVGPPLAGELEAILRLPAGRVDVVANALPPLDPPPRRPGERFVVGALARFVRHKAVDQLISAVAATEDAHLLLGGDGPERERLEQLAWRLGLGSRVNFLGWVDPDVVLSNCDIVASAARIEGHPLTLLDARRRGLPIVATDVGGVRDIVEDGVSGVLVPAGHVLGLSAAISTLARDRSTRAAMSEAALAAANADDPEAIAAAFCELYWPAAASTRRRARDQNGSPCPA